MSRGRKPKQKQHEMPKLLTNYNYEFEINEKVLAKSDNLWYEAVIRNRKAEEKK